MSRKSSAKETYWRKILEEHGQSDESVRSFCRQRGLTETSFYFWKKKLPKRRWARSPRRAAPGSAAKKGSPGSSVSQSKASVFIPLRVAGASDGTLELVHPRGHLLRIPAGLDRELLQQVLELLDSAGEA